MLFGLSLKTNYENVGSQEQISNMARGEQPKWLVVGATLERELDDVCDIWAPARVTAISTNGVLVEYEDGLIEADVPFEELRQVSSLPAPAHVLKIFLNEPTMC